ncbi:hypothetical protein [Mycobacterium pseudokansasii]|uniref:hypothetical protein n=1 Tax=Mycobacterium pseudokansasii TaxID=2341080 RepID=UPI0010A956C3|nr:hypothetical protein [Mycobacterium pseudokansasii]
MDASRVLGADDGSPAEMLARIMGEPVKRKPADWSALTESTAAKAGPPLTDEEAAGWYAKVGGVGEFASQPWIPLPEAVAARIVYPKGQNRQAKCWHLMDYDAVNETPSWADEIHPPPRRESYSGKEYHSDDPYAPGWYPALNRDVGKLDDQGKPILRPLLDKLKSDDRGQVWTDPHGPGRTWDGRDAVRYEGGRKVDPDGYDDDGDDNDVVHRVRRVDPTHDGGRAPDGEPVTMRPGYWQVARWAKWSAAHTRCEICGRDDLPRSGKRRPCEFEPWGGCRCNGCSWEAVNNSKRRYHPGDCTEEAGRRDDARHYRRKQRKAGKPRYLHPRVPTDVLVDLSQIVTGGLRASSWYQQPSFPDPVEAEGIWTAARWFCERIWWPPEYADPTGEAAARLPVVRLESPAPAVWSIRSIRSAA